MTKDEAIKIVRKTYPDLTSAKVTETEHYFIFFKVWSRAYSADHGQKVERRV